MNLTRFPVLNHAVLCLSILIMSSAAFSFLSGQNQESAAQESNSPGNEYQAWLQIQSDPSLDDSEKIKSTVTTFFRVVFESWLEKKWHDFGFLFDQADPVAMADYAYEKGFHQVWIARWRDYGIQMPSYDFQPRYLRYSKDSDRAKTQATAEARLRFSDNPERPDFRFFCLGGGFPTRPPSLGAQFDFRQRPDLSSPTTASGKRCGLHLE